VISYGDCLFIVGVVVAAMIALVWFCKPVKGALVAH
jgi:hypothetical protein